MTPARRFGQRWTLDAAREAVTRGPYAGRRDRAEPLARADPPETGVLGHGAHPRHGRPASRHSSSTSWAYMTDSSHWDEIQPRAKHTELPAGLLDQTAGYHLRPDRADDGLRDEDHVHGRRGRAAAAPPRPGRARPVGHAPGGPSPRATPPASSSSPTTRPPGKLPEIDDEFDDQGLDGTGTCRGRSSTSKVFTEATVPAHAGGIRSPTAARGTAAPGIPTRSDPP